MTLDDYSSARSTADLVLRHPLVIAALQLFAAVVLAYVGTERWQRWRQRRDFQYQTMAKLSESSMEMFVQLGDLLVKRVHNPPISREEQRPYIAQRIAFHSLEPGIMASFKQGDILTAYYALNQKATTLFDLVQQKRERPLDFTDFVEIQEAFLIERKDLLGRMIGEMKLLSWRERRAIRRKPLKTGSQTK